jgi:hypothetical protein
MNLSTLETETDQLNKVVRDAGIALAAAREEFRQAGQRYQDVKSGTEAIGLLNRWKEETLAAGLELPENLSSIPLEAIAQLRGPLILKLNSQAQVDHATAVGNRHMDITVPQRFKVGQRDWKAAGRTFAANQIYSACEVPAGLLARALKYRTCFRVEPEQSTAA